MCKCAGGTGVEIIMYMQVGLLKGLCIDNNIEWGVQIVWVAILLVVEESYGLGLEAV